MRVYLTSTVRFPGNPMSASGLTCLNSTPFGTSCASQTQLSKPIGPPCSALRQSFTGIW